MYLSNQPQDLFSQQKLSFAPVSSKISNVGTTVTYGIQSANAINAFNPNMTASGNFTNMQQAGWNQPGLNQMGYNWQQMGYNYQPMITAGFYNQGLSGNISGFQQMGQSIFVQPAVDISETTSDVVVAAHLPNVALNDISLSCTENSVTITASAWTGAQSMAFNRTIALPTSIRSDAVDANLQSGILEIRCPKVEKSVRKRTTVNQDNIQQK